MADKKYRVELEEAERKRLQRMTTSGTIQVRQLKRAEALLLADEVSKTGGKADRAIAEQIGVSERTVQRVRAQYCTEGLEATLHEKPRAGRPPPFSGAERAQITALACSDPPAGHAQWSLRLLADRAVELEVVESISHETVGEILKKTCSGPT